MNSALYIARKIIRGRKDKSLSNPVVNIAVLSVALSVAVMLIAVVSVQGFKTEIARMVSGFAGHISIRSFDNNDSYEANAIYTDSVDVKKLRANTDIVAIQQIATKAGILKSQTDMQGIALKGYGSDYNPEFFKSNLVEGRNIRFADSLTNDIIISAIIATQMNLHCSDKVLCYFVQQPPRVRKFNIVGIYKTGLEEFDNSIVICDIRHIQKLNSWQPNEIGGYEIFLHDFESIDKVTMAVNEASSFNIRAESIIEKFPQIFNWLNLINGNVIVILVLMIIIACVNMIATLLILILDNTNTIGMLKALGARNRMVRQIFLYIACYLTFLGIVIGNIIGLGLAFIQHKFGLLKLPQETYYLDVAPIQFDWFLITGINLGAFVLCILFLLIPIAWIARVEPVKVIRFQ